MMLSKPFLLIGVLIWNTFLAEPPIPAFQIIHDSIPMLSAGSLCRPQYGKNAINSHTGLGPATVAYYLHGISVQFVFFFFKFGGNSPHFRTLNSMWEIF